MAISRENKPDIGSDRGVQGRLLDAAEELFCERGYEATSVRDLAAAANCNIASVNYYFGGKDKLYTELWRRYLVVMRDTRIAGIQKVMAQNHGTPSLENLLTSFANAFIEPLVDRSRTQRFAKLMAREMLDQRLPRDMFVTEVIVPTVTAMHQALMKICPQLDPTKVHLIVYSVVAQLVHAVHIRAMFQQTAHPSLPTFDLAQAVDHIVKFSTAGVRAYVK
jgi:AcrR family transcriptional regulator